MTTNFAQTVRRVAIMATLVTLFALSIGTISAAPTGGKLALARPYTTCSIQVDRVMATTGWVNDSGNGLTNASMYSTIVGRVDLQDGTYCDHLYGQTAIRFNQSGSQCATAYSIVYTWTSGGTIKGNGPYSNSGCGQNGFTLYESSPLFLVPFSAWCKAENVGYGNVGFYHGTTLLGIFWHFGC